MLLEIPKNAKVLELPSSTIWFDGDGLLYSAAKGGPPVNRSMEDLTEDMKKVRNFIGSRKVCIIIESNNRSGSPPREQRDAIADALNAVTKAMAVVSSSPLSRMVANLFFSFRPPAFPMKLFANVHEAREWISKYL